ncbi:22634_t:CDS:2, partial [Gigaspora margarita]
RNEAQKLRKFVSSLRETVTHDQWVEADHVRGHIASGITDVLSQEIKLEELPGFRKHINMAISIYHLPVDFEVEITRSERQSIAKMGRNIFFESGKWGADKYKIHHDHNKLTQFCLAESKELVKN